jgi:hypothetical protein
MRKFVIMLLIAVLGATSLMIMPACTGTIEANANTIFSSGWENSNGSNVADGGAWSSDSTGAVVTIPVYNGNYAASFSATPSSAIGATKTLNATYGTLYFRAYFYFPSAIPANTWVVLISLSDSDWENGVQVVLQNTAGYSQWQLTTPSNTYSSLPTVISPNKWYCVEVARQITSSNGAAALWVDGNMLCNSTSITMIYGTRNVFLGVSDCGSSNFTAVADDVVASTTGPIGPELPSPSPSTTLSPTPSLSPTQTSTPSPRATPVLTSTPTTTPAPTLGQTPTLAAMGEYLSVIAAAIILGGLIIGVFIQRRKR